MNEKISINIEVLGVNEVHNYLVPINMSVSKVIVLILKTLKEEYPKVRCDNLKMHMLIQRNTGQALLQNCGLKQLGIVNGETLLLV